VKPIVIAVMFSMMYLIGIRDDVLDDEHHDHHTDAVLVGQQHRLFDRPNV
jgi:hypothetical protein